MRLFKIVFLALVCAGIASPQDKGIAAPTNKEKTDVGTATKTGPIDPEKEKDIRKLLEVTGTNARMQQVFTEMEKSIRPVLQNSLPPGAYREKLIDAFFVKLHAKANVQELLNEAVPVYDQQFSREEIKGLLQFYDTPLGKKTLSVLPAIMSQMMEKGRQWGEDVGRQSMMEVLAEHPEFQQAIEEAQKKAQP